MSDLVKTPERLKQSILQEAMQGKLTKQLPSDGNADDLLQSIQQKKQQLIQSGKIRRHKIPDVKKNPFTIPTSWRFVRLYNVSNITTGFSFKKKMYVSHGTRIIRISDFNEHGIINKRPAYVIYNDKYERFLIKSGDILMAMTGGTVGKTSPVLNISHKCLLNQRVARFQSIGILTMFLEYYLESPYVINNVNNNKNSTNDNISMTFLNKLCIPIPPLSEQHRIVQRLNEILPKVDDLNKDVVKLDQIRTKFPHRLKQSLLLEAMKGHLTQQLPSDGTADDLLKKIKQKKQQLIRAGKIRKHKKLPPISKDEIPFKIPKNWKWVRLQDICNYIQKGKSPKYSKVGYPILNQKCIRWDGINFNFHKNISLNVFNTFNGHRLLKSGDILWNTTGTGTLGRLSIVTSGLLLNYPKIVVNGDVMIIRSSSKMDSVYLLKFLSSPIIQKYLDKIITGSTKQIHLNLSVVLPLVIPLPPLNEQHRIVSKLHDLFNAVND